MRALQAGRGAFYLYRGGAISSDSVRSLNALRLELWRRRPGSVRDIIVGYTSLLVEHDPAARQDRLMAWATDVAAADPPPITATHHDLNVQYGLAADRELLEARLGLPWDDIVARHQAALYTVAFIGFTPGFPYLLGLPQALHTGRRDTPRTSIPAGAVAIAGAQAGVYPRASPGGWWVLGRTDARLYSSGADPPTLLAPGDTVRFIPVDQLTAAAPALPEPPRLGEPTGRVEEVWPGSASLQTRPHWGQGHFGLPQGGPLDPLAADLANRIVGNPVGAGVLEVVAQPLCLRVLAPTTLSVTGGGLRLELENREGPRWQALEVAAGATLRLLPDPRVTGLTTYLAFKGGLVGPAPLEPGAVLKAATIPVGTAQPHPGVPRYPERVMLRLYRGPQYEAAAFAHLLGSSYRVERLNRMGVRLSGPAVPLDTHDVTSEGSPWGAVQVPASGQPIILLADRGRTGGYAKPGVCDPRDLWQLAQAAPGTEVWFTPAQS